MTASVYTGDPDWPNHIDGVDVLFQKSGTGTSTTYTLKATNPGTFKYRLSLENETGLDIHVKGKQLPNIVRNGVSIKDANGGSTTVFLTVPSMPTSVGVSTYPLDLRPTGRAGLPAHRLVAGHGAPGRPVGRHADHRLVHPGTARLAVGLGLLDGVGLSAPAVARRQPRRPVHPDRRPRDPEAPRGPRPRRVRVPLEEHRQLGQRHDRPDAAVPRRLQLQVDDRHRARRPAAGRPGSLRPAAQPAAGRGSPTLPSTSSSACGTRPTTGNHALGLTFAGERMTAVGGFVFDPSGNGRPDITVRVFKAVAEPAPTAATRLRRLGGERLGREPRRLVHDRLGRLLLHLAEAARQHRGASRHATPSRAGSSTTSRCATSRTRSGRRHGDAVRPALLAGAVDVEHPRQQGVRRGGLLRQRADQPDVHRPADHGQGQQDPGHRSRSRCSTASATS